MLASYLRADGLLLDAIAAGMASRDALAVAKAVHKLKSSSGILGAKALAARCAELEALARTDRLAEAGALAEEVLGGTRAFRSVVERAHVLAQARLAARSAAPA